MPSNSSYLERLETDNYVIIVHDPNHHDNVFSEECIINVRSKKSGVVVPYIGAKSLGKFSKDVFDRIVDLQLRSSIHAEIMLREALDISADTVGPNEKERLYELGGIIRLSVLEHVDYGLHAIDDKTAKIEETRKGLIDKLIELDINQGFEGRSGKFNLGSKHLIEHINSMADRKFAHDTFRTRNRVESTQNTLELLGDYLDPNLREDINNYIGLCLYADSDTFSYQRLRIINRLEQDLNINFSSEHKQMLAEEVHKAFLIEGGSTLPFEQLVTSPLFDSVGRTEVNVASMDDTLGSLQNIYNGGSHGLSIAKMTSEPSPIARRNFFQVLKSVDYSIGLINLLEFKRSGVDFSRPISDALREQQLSYSRNDRPQTIKYKMGKKESLLLSRNSKSLHDIIYRGETSKIITHDGLSLEIIPISRLDLIQCMDKTKESFVGFWKNESDNSNLLNDIGAEDAWDVIGNDGGHAISHRYQNPAFVVVKDTSGELLFKDAIDVAWISYAGPKASTIIADIPSSCFSKKGDLMVLKSLQNGVLTDSLYEGYLNNKSKADKADASYRNPWSSMVKIARECFSDNDNFQSRSNALNNSSSFNKYFQPTFVNDGIRIATSINSAIAASSLIGSGVEINPIFDDIDSLSEVTDSARSRTVLVRSNFEDVDIDLDSVIKFPGHNYNKHIRMSENIHKGYSRVASATSPESDVSWEPCMDKVRLRADNGRDITFTPLAKLTDIIHEGSIMNHCVASYGMDCVRADYVVFQIHEGDQHVGTLGMTVENDEPIYDQAFGYSNSSLSGSVMDCVNRFAEELETEGSVNGSTFEIHQGASAEDLDPSDLLSLQFGYELQDNNKRLALIEFLKDSVGHEAAARLQERVLESALEVMEADHYSKPYYDEYEDEWVEEDSVHEPTIRKMVNALSNTQRDYGLVGESNELSAS